MLLELHNTPQKSSPQPVDLSPLFCLLVWNGWFLRALCLCSVVKVKQWPHLWTFLPGRLVFLFTVWIRHSWMGLDCRENISLKLHPKPLFLYNSVSVIDYCKKCCQTLFLLLTQFPSALAIHTHHSSSLCVACILQTCSFLNTQEPSTTVKATSRQ